MFILVVVLCDIIFICFEKMCILFGNVSFFLCFFIKLWFLWIINMGMFVIFNCFIFFEKCVWVWIFWFLLLYIFLVIKMKFIVFFIVIVVICFNDWNVFFCMVEKSGCGSVESLMKGLFKCKLVICKNWIFFMIFVFYKNWIYVFIILYYYVRYKYF